MSQKSLADEDLAILSPKELVTFKSCGTGIFCHFPIAHIQMLFMAM